MSELSTWEKAQLAEVKWWQNEFQTAIDRKLLRKSIYKVYPYNRLRGILEAHCRDNDDKFTDEGKNFLEIGSGPYPFIFCYPKAKKRVAVDPLFDLYAKYTGFKSGDKHHGVRFVKSKIEDFEYYKEKVFDVAFMSNCIDHLDDPAKGLSVVMKYLKDTGFILIDFYVRNPEPPLHPWGWPTIGAFENWFKEHFPTGWKTKYVRIGHEVSNGKAKLYVRLVRKDGITE